MTHLVDRFEQALLSLDRLAVRNMLTEFKEEYTPIQFVESVVVPALERTGEAWTQGKVALAQIYMSGRICEELVDTILPPAHPQRKSQHRMAVAVLEDYHLLGKRIVYSLLRASGFELLDYKRVNVEEVVHQVISDEVKILLISTLMLPSALRIKEVRAKLKAAGKKVKIVVGGAPFLFDDILWKEVGADAMCENASESVETINQIIGEIS